MLEGHHFQLWTNHKLLLADLNQVSQPWMPRQQRHLAFIAECTNDVRHVPGIFNMVADQLSRPLDTPECQVTTHQQSTTPTSQVAASDLPAGPEATVQLPTINYTDMAAAQEFSPGVATLHTPSGLSIIMRDLEGNIKRHVHLKPLHIPVPGAALATSTLIRLAPLPSSGG